MQATKKEIAIKVDNVSKDFILVHERKGTIKGVFTSMFRHATIKKETQHALKNISFEIKKGEFFGIVGRNGSGKSTMLKILAGIYQPTKGSTTINGRLVPFIELGVGFNTELSGRDNVYLNGAVLGFSKKEIDDMYDDIVQFAEMERFMDQKLKNYSSGMQVRLAFSMATRAKADILLVDEVLAVGDADFQRKCFNYFKQLKKNKTTVVFVTHDMSSVREYCDRAIMIEKSEIIAAGSANKVATKYTRMFIEDATTDNAKESNKNKNRWGTGELKFTSPKIVVNDDFIEINAEAKAKEKVENVNLGFSISDAAGQKLMGTNSVIKKKKIPKIAKGATVEVKWKFQNILRDGEYFVDLAAVNTNNTVWDWWEESAMFRVRKEESTIYSVHPNIELEVK